jgi:uncharacterized membrane protein YjjP (DUF1212 family)
MSLTPVEIAADVVAGSLAASKLLTAAQSYWAKLPKWLAVVLPVLVMDLPLVANAFGLVQTSTDLTTAVITSVALLLPGVASAETAK